LVGKVLWYVTNGSRNCVTVELEKDFDVDLQTQPRYSIAYSMGCMKNLPYVDPGIRFEGT
jgi:hypothetical protein